MADDSERSGTLEISRVIGRALRIFGAYPGLMVALAAMLLVGPMVAFLIAAVAVGALMGENPGSVILVGIGIGFFASWILSVALFQAAVTRASVVALRDGHPAIMDCAGVALSRLPQLIGLMLITAIALIGGFILAFFPGLMIMCALIVVVPALIDERQGVLAAISRSVELTRGSRWRIFGLIGIYLVAYWLSSAAIGIMTIAAPTLSTIISLLWVIVGTAVSSAGVASIYVELRTCVEGESFADLAAIFV